MSKAFGVHCPECGKFGALVLIENIKVFEEPDKEKYYDNLKCENCNHEWREYHKGKGDTRAW